MTLMNTTDSNSQLCGFMRLVEQFIKDQTSYKVLAFNESLTDSPRVMRLSVFISEKDYTLAEDKGAWALELDDYAHAHRFPWAES